MTFTQLSKKVAFFVAAFIAALFSNPIAAQSHQNQDKNHHTQNHHTQNHLEGKVYDATTQEPLIGATLLWKTAATTKGTVTDANGVFHLDKSLETDTLLVSYVGFQTDTLLIAAEQNYIEIALKSVVLNEVEVTANLGLDREIQQAELLTVKDLRKAACCNLAESFETNASVDAATTDAVSGNRQIRLLGLDGRFSQLMVESLPMMRGLNLRAGLHFIPGTWVQSIDINKGAGSVANGYESMTGQINVELVKPENMLQNGEKLFLNAYLNQFGRAELNAHTAYKISPRWSQLWLLHGSTQVREMDENNDNFMDSPRYKQANAFTRFKYEGKKMEAMLGGRFLWEDKISGQNGSSFNDKSADNTRYNVAMENKKADFFAKVGFFINSKTTFGNQFSAQYHQSQNVWGLRQFEGTQTQLYYNGILETELSETHKLRAGLSLTYDDFGQQYQDRLSDSLRLYDWSRKEKVAGAFFEHTLKAAKFQAVSGLRMDYHNLWGLIPIARLHLKYEFSEKTILRASAGNGFRLVNPTIDFGNFLPSGRILQVESLEPERLWNFGVSLAQQLSVGGRKGRVVADFYHTRFQNQVVADVETAGILAIYNLQDQSCANSFQIQTELEPFKGFEISAAYKFYDVQAAFRNPTPQQKSQMRQMPLTPKHRFFINTAYTTANEKWNFDLTGQWVGSQRLSASPLDTQSQSPAYMLWNGQITRSFPKWDLYVGGENLLNFIQPNAILDAQNPFSNQFDAGRIWGNVMGRMVYVGMRISVK
ncbi:TonB-dependent receptor [Hugenholtzia roseola]|uniref:TonB-dependent receptor n=1 Tax=Hugenholtzia roseola TaxID=1002 RepID=UPI0003FC7055|nr:TonB-dependent receptor [Hugenholtzia roseola]